jgi:glycosyltransferase involved in cell wall biosynthesis
MHSVITVSDETRDLLVGAFRVPAPAVQIVLNGVPLPGAAAEPARPAGGGPCVGSLGRLVKEKAFDVFVDAMALVVSRGPRVEFRIAGEGPERPALESRADGLALSLPGEVVDTTAFLRQLDVFCISSRREGLPFALLEAMALGIPCVSTDVGQIRSALGGAVVVVPPEQPRALAQAVQQLLDDPAARTTLGQRGRALVEERHDVRRMADVTLRLYGDALRTGRRHRHTTVR